MTRKKLIFVLSGLLVLLILTWLYNTSFVTLSATGGGQGAYTYQLTKVGANKTKTVISRQAEVKVMVSRGAYQVLISRSGQTFFGHVKTKGWMDDTGLGGQLSPENSRSFAGNNPSDCLGMADQVVISYGCSGDFASIRAHQPATANEATYVKTNSSSSVFGTVGGSAPFGKNLYFLVKTTSDGFYGQSQYQLMGVDSSLTTVSTRVLNSLSAQVNYHLTALGGGFLIYSDDFSKLYQLKNPTDDLSALRLASPTTNGLSPTSISTVSDSVLAFYSGKTASEVVSSDGAYKINHAYGTAWPCATSTVCLLDKGGLFDIYSLSSGKPKMLYSLSGIKQASQAKDRMLLVTQSSILSFDVTARKGYVAYSFGSYKFCGLASAPEPLACIADPAGKKTVLELDLSKDDDSSIDKKLAELEKSRLVDSISAYGSYIFVTPKLGPIEYQPSLGEYGYDPEVVAQVNRQLSSTILALGLDPNVYKLKILD